MATDAPGWAGLPAKQRLIVVALLVAAGVGLFLGWRLFRFQCDDAYIAFRYAHNLVHGRGLTWNPPPFAPVEGYSSLLWVLLLSAAWALTGLVPPTTANPLALVASMGSLVVACAMVLRLPLGPATARWRLVLLGLVLSGIVSNRTFLVWSSSGLDQALFTLVLVSWVYVGLFRPLSRGQLLGLAGLAGIMELTRPDGLLYVAATAGLVLLAVAERWSGGRRDPRDLWLVVPFLLPLGHEIWRLWMYGAPLPNPWYAKAAGAWPLSGLLYVFTFLVEHAYVLWIPLVVRAFRHWPSAERDPRAWSTQRRLRVGVGVTLVAHWAYYTFVIGGDHFGWRIYMHWIPLLLVAFPWFADRAGLAGPRVAPAMAGAVALGLVLPWTHWWYTSDLDRARANGWDPSLIHEHFPLPLKWWPLAYDLPQIYLRSHFVAIRRRAHVTYIRRQMQRFPTREETLRMDMGDDIPVIVLHGVGYPGWVMPDVAIIDALGLNDAVVARNRLPPGKRRKMAHDRAAPEGYLQCFRPNASAKDGVLRIKPRAPPLTSEDIVDCETRFMDRVTGRGSDG